MENINQLIAWHENDEHQRIIDAIETIPRNQRDFELSGLYARALNNLDRFQEALEVLTAFAEEGRENGLWHFRVGYSLYYLNREAEAADYFLKAIAFGDDVEDTREMLRRSRLRATLKATLQRGETRPPIFAAELQKPGKDPWDFLFVLLDKYFEMIAIDNTLPQRFSPSQHTLLAFQYLSGQVSNGGFIQLIHNRYGPYIFDNPFSETIKAWGAAEIAKITEEAKILYIIYKKKLEAEMPMEEFSKLYEEIQDFQPLEDRFDEIMDSETEKVTKYVTEHIREFAILL
ncbi:MAG: DMP19 family protein [Spirochaetaceae bacterium]|jgi:tetratricopeptide (TPR) repeat protein|nr:DMP19 family protein [Spirochaetaceae bacterium]